MGCLSLLLIALLGACSDDTGAGTEADVDAATGTRDTRPSHQDSGLGEDSSSDDIQDEATDVEMDLNEETGEVDADGGGEDLGTPDTIPDAVEEPDSSVLSDVSADLPIATDDCDPLGIPNDWFGTFDGEITSNMPDMAGYTFEGPVEGEIGFEIRCVNEKLMVFGTLDGGSTNCALESGCPFTADLEGIYDPATSTMEGQVLNASIDFTAVQIYAEGLFSGTLFDGPVLRGDWSGEKTGISSSILEWVEANGVGTWEVFPVE